MKQTMTVIVAMLIFVAGVIVGNLFEIRLASAKNGEVSITFDNTNEKGFSGGRLKRARVPGGWLVISANTGMAFIPDQSHQWK